MKIKYVKGDLFKTKIKHILHGCNDLGVMGAGVAKIIKDRFPEAYEVYHKDKNLTQGKIIPVESNNKVILNAITQKGVGLGAVNYDAIRKVMKQINDDPTIKIVAMPKIGAGLAGGDWDKISAIIEKEMTKTIPVVYVID